MNELEKIIVTARQLREKMGVFPQLDKPVSEMIFAVSKYGAYYENGFADVELVGGPYPKRQFPSMAEYWDYVCGVLQNPKTSLADKAKALVGFDRTIATHYLRNVTPEQWGVYQRVNNLLNMLVVSIDKLPCVVYYKLTSNGVVVSAGGPKVELNAQSLENRIFLDYDQLKKLYKFTTESGWSNGVPYRTRVFNVTYIQID